MAFDPSTAKPFSFDPSTAKPADAATLPSAASELPSVLTTAYQPAQYAGEAPRRGGMVGAIRGMQQPGFVPPKIETTGDVGEAVGEYAKGAGIGVVSGIPGLPGDIEALYRALPINLNLPFVSKSKKNILPTSEEVGTYIFGEPETQEEKAARMVGSMFGPNIAGDVVGAAGRLALGRPSPVMAKEAQKLESLLGASLEPAQLKQDVPIVSPGAEPAKIEKKITQLAAKEAGIDANIIDDAVLKKRQTELGREYNKIFSNDFNVNRGQAQALNDILNFEVSISPATSGDVAGTAANIVRKYNAEIRRREAELLQKQMQKQMQKTRPTGASGFPTEATRYFENIRTEGGANLPVWYDDVNKTVQELSSQLGVKIPPIWVGSPRRAASTYGLAHRTDGWVVVLDNLDPKGALATALHEFGHQADFQIFRKADQKTLDAVRDAWRAHATQPTGQKTMGQYRPITAEKYGPQSYGAIPPKDYEQNYLRAFEEWFAEQTSRWITQTKEPTTLVEKFFSKIGDVWRQIYQKVTGYVPLASEVDAFFRANWKGNLVTDAAKQTGVLPELNVLQSVFDVPVKINGREFQQLRSNLSNLRNSHPDGNVRFRAGQLLEQLDGIVAGTSEKIAADLAKANRQYAALSTLQEGNRDFSFVTQSGYVDPMKLGQYLAGQIPSYGYGASQHPLAELGRYGMRMGLTSRASGASRRVPYEDPLSALLGRGKRILSTALLAKTPAARRVQKGEPILPADIARRRTRVPAMPGTPDEEE